MSAVFHQRDIEITKRECFSHFGIPDMTLAGKLPKELRHKQQICSDANDRFFAAMNSDKRPGGREEAIRAVLPALWWITIIFSPETIRIIRAIAEWLWRRTQD